MSKITKEEHLTIVLAHALEMRITQAEAEALERKRPGYYAGLSAAYAQALCDRSDDEWDWGCA